MYVEKLKKDGKLASGQKFLHDNLVLIVSNSAKDKVKSVEDLVKPGVKVGICDPSAPVGVYAENALKKLNLWDRKKRDSVLQAAKIGGGLHQGLHTRTGYQPCPEKG